MDEFQLANHRYSPAFAGASLKGEFVQRADNLARRLFPRICGGFIEGKIQ